MRDFFFRYESYGYGCATVKMRAGTQEVLFNASYIGNNPMGDMLEALHNMFNDDRDELYWMSEPGVLRLSIEVQEGIAHITVEESDLDVDYRKVKDAQWKKKLETVIPLTQLVNVVVEEAERNLLLHGLVGFSEDWCDQTDVFPMSAYLRLKGIDCICGDDHLRRSSFEEEILMLTHLLKTRGNNGDI